MKALRVKKHLIGGDTEVSLEVPEFENFGVRYEELECRAYEADPVDPEEVQASTAMLMAQVKSQREAAHKKLEAMPAGPKKEMNKMMLGMLEQMAKAAAEAGEDSDTEEDSEGEEPEKRDPHLLELTLPRKIKWNKKTEALLAEFFAGWTKLRPAVLRAIFDYYKGIYPELAQVYGKEKGSQFLYPKPTSPEVIADIFYFQSVHLHDDDSIGLSGHCTWDEEHGFGIVVREGKVAEVGSADIAY